MEKIRVMTSLILVAAIAYLLCGMSGLVDDINKSFDETVAVDQTQINTSMNRFYSIYVSVLKDPKIKDLKIYRGTMKKSAVDRMSHIKNLTVKVYSKEQIEPTLKTIVRKAGGNVAIINSEEMGVDIIHN